MARSECPLPFILLCLDVLFKWRGSIVPLRLSRVLQTQEKTQSHLFTGNVVHKPLDSSLTSTSLSLLLVLFIQTYLSCTHDAKHPMLLWCIHTALRWLAFLFSLCDSLEVILLDPIVDLHYNVLRKLRYI